MDKGMQKQVVVGFIVGFIILFVAGGLGILWFTGLLFPPMQKTAVFTIIPLSSPTINHIMRTADGNNISGGDSSDSNELISVGTYVQIKGTGAVGLKIRTDPGLGGEVQFVAMENEVFFVSDGPVQKDGITWWRLTATYDKNRQGWAAGQYLAVVQ